MAESNEKYKLDKEDSQNQRKMLRFCRNDIKLQLKFNEEQRIGGRESFEVRRLRKSKVLAFNFASKQTEAEVVQKKGNSKLLKHMTSSEQEALHSQV